MMKDKQLYWKLQNLEDHLDAIDEARSRLIELFDQTLAASLADPPSTILSIAKYEPKSLKNFLHTSHRSAANKYEAYIQRRQARGPREMFPNKAYALEWLNLAGVVKYVDGGWVGGILGIGTGGSTAKADVANIGPSRADIDATLERKVSKVAWQVVSEEFGDGDLEKNHIYLYEKLMNEKKLGAILPDGRSSPGHMRGFDGLRNDQGVPRCWEAAVAQQCIGLLASTNEFFSEALGFNMAYESLPYHLLVTTKELKELNIDNYYFAIHVTIDNADSGHSAMARMAVERYLDGIKVRDGEEVMQAIWKRIQVGYILAEGLPTTPKSPVEFGMSKTTCGQTEWLPRGTPIKPATEAEGALRGLIIKKSKAAEKMHCISRMKVGNRSIEEWLDPHTISEDKILNFLRQLSDKRPFVVKGEPERSRFMKDLEWGGKMFGAFTGSEVYAVRDWIKSLEPRLSCQGTYQDFTAQLDLKKENSAKQQGASAFETKAKDLWTLHDPTPLPSLSDDRFIPADHLISHTNNSFTLTFNKIRPLWYVSTSLFECFPLQPCRFATPLGMFSLRLFRSGLGFGALHLPQDICAGTDDLTIEKQDKDLMGIWEIGVDIDRACGTLPPVDVIDLARGTPEGKVNRFCAKILELRIRPYNNASVLFGMALALSQGLYNNEAILNLPSSDEVRCTLKRIAREQIGIIAESAAYKRESFRGSEWEKEFAQGYFWAQAGISEI
ncbi:uncharacterized protein I303_104858 [Kwoniella dejecticola CBS 10117]|uniref:Uncharacterized protein n=1 Tax=Kwoniella dejecticola CBS 10117 TaxID=1296121 RepID=A0A1A6A457_9TREE|nr:uncharacterized protein I303_04159 [Kwoniella dejecticola CBS 10117]OBR84838.1 hypothetical protein I303_04159 [Kwoniella dejecticola CBS 10117]